MTNPLNDTTPLTFADLPWYYCTYRGYPIGCAWHSGKGEASITQTRVEARKLLSDHMNEKHNPRSSK